VIILLIIDNVQKMNIAYDVPILLDVITTDAGVK